MITDCLVKDLEAFRRQKGLYKQRSVDWWFIDLQYTIINKEDPYNHVFH